MRFSPAVLFPILFPTVLASQATTVEEPPSPSLLEMFVRPWAMELSLGDLRTVVLADSAIEVRFWEGFGLGGVRALVLRRTPAGEWSVLRPVIDGKYATRMDTLKISEKLLYHPKLAWPSLVHMGILQLPTRIPRTWMMLDGHSYVLEVRRGQHYRASEIEHLEKPEVAGDATIRRIADVLRRFFDP